MKKKVMVGMSGGVDSSAAALILQNEGFDVCGATLKLFSNDEIDINSKMRTCCSLSDVEDARWVCRKLGIDHFVFNFRTDFDRCVIKKFISSYENGETPNPCIDCNKYIKFSKMLERALVLDCDYIATGHYVSREYDKKTGRYLLKKAADNTKDQTYVLYNMTQDQLKHTLFPLGKYKKPEIRHIAEENGLINARKPDSQDICFVPDGDYAKFIEFSKKSPAKPGNFTDKNGNILGSHNGIIHYTIGQRKGLGITFGKPKFVVSKNALDNTVTLGDNEDLFSTTLTACDLNWILIDSLKEPMRVKIKARYKQPEADGTIEPKDNGDVLVTFDEPVRAISPGQAVVFYKDEYVVGGGTIKQP